MTVIFPSPYLLTLFDSVFFVVVVVVALLPRTVNWTLPTSTSWSSTNNKWSSSKPSSTQGKPSSQTFRPPLHPVLDYSDTVKFMVGVSRSLVERFSCSSFPCLLSNPGQVVLCPTSLFLCRGFTSPEREESREEIGESEREVWTSIPWRNTFT